MSTIRRGAASGLMIGDRRLRRPRTPVEDSPDRAHASRCQSGAKRELRARLGSLSAHWLVMTASRSTARLHLAPSLPQEGGELAGHGDADLVGVHAACGEPAVTRTQAQLRTPRDIAHRARLAFLSFGHRTAHACGVAV